MKKPLPPEPAAREASYRDLFEGAVDAILVGGPGGVLVDANALAEELTGRPRADLIGRTILSLFPPEEAARVPFRYDLVDAGTRVIRERDLARPDGTRVPVEMVSSRLPDGRYLAFLRDITQRRRAEAALHYRRAFDRLVSGLSTRFINLDPELVDREIEAALEAVGEFCGADRAYVFEISADDAFHSNTHEWCASGIAPQRDRLQSIPFDRFSSVTSTLRRGEAYAVPDVAELPDGPERGEFEAESIRSLVCAPIFERERLSGFAGLDSVRGKRAFTEDEIALLRIVGEIIYNALGRRRAERERLEMERRALHAQKLESLGLLAGGIAHDFNNLLNAVLGHLSLAMDHVPEDSPAREPLGDVEQAARRAADLTRQMLAYSGRGRFRAEPVDMAACVREIRDLLSASVGRKATFELACDGDLPPVVADRVQVHQVALNLIVNAAESLPDGVGTVRVILREVRASASCLAKSRLREIPPPGRFVELCVEDTGAGISPADLGRLFEPFFTTKFSGRGLGLATVHGIVRAHRGALLVESEPGRGSRFRALFPADPATGAEVPHGEDLPARGAHPAPSRAAGEGEALLVADDEPLVRKFCERLLARAGYRVYTAADGREAYDVARDHPEIAAAVIDLTMPELDGVEAFHNLRALRPGFRAVLVTGFDGTTGSALSERHGFARTLVKPFSAEELLDAVGALFRNDGD